MMGLLSMFGASPETVDRVQRGLLDFGNAFPEIRRQRMEEQATVEDRDWLKKQRQAKLDAEAAAAEREKQRLGYLDSVSPTMGPAMPVDPARAIANGITTQELGALMPKGPDLMNVGPGGAVFDPRTGKPVFQAPFKPEAPAPTELSRLIGEMQSMPPGHPLRPYYEAQIKKMTTHSPGVSVSYGQPMAGVDASGNPVFFQPAKGGGAPSIVPGVKPPPGAGGVASEDERKAAGWFNQANNSYQNMLKVLRENKGAAKPNIGLELTRRIPMVGEPIANAATSEPRQRFEQAASSFAEAALRAATGAGVTKDEAAQKIKELTPQWGDKDGTVAQKSRDMQVYLQSLRTRAGRAAVQPSDNGGWSVEVEN